MKRMVFVFGSNLAGRHGRGAALFAKMHYGAIYGQGEGIQGNSYAIPTKYASLRRRSLAEIKPAVDTFLEYAASPEQRDTYFKVTAIGTGLAGYPAATMARLFQQEEPAGNVWYDPRWKPYLPRAKFWHYESS